MRQLLVQAAAETFSKKRYEDVTTLEVAAKAGVSASVLYRKFPTKADLFKEAVLQPFTDFLVQFRVAYADQDLQQGELELVTEFMLELYDHLHRHRAVLVGLLAAEPTLDAEAGREVRGVFEAIFDELTSFGREQSRMRGWFPDQNMELTPRLLVSMVTAMVTFEPWFRPDGPPGERELMGETMARLILYGMRLAPP